VSTFAALAAELEILTAALDEPDADVAHSLRRLALDAAAAVSTYLGLSILVSSAEPPFAFTALADGVVAGDIRTSLRVVVPGLGEGGQPLAVAVILYAGSPGAFVDLAADLAWLTGWPPSDIVLDQHVGVPIPPEVRMQLHAASTINQAIGVLIGRGYTPQQANQKLGSQTGFACANRLAAAQLILAELTASDPEEDLGSP
jgi:hypothetical protein